MAAGRRRETDHGKIFPLRKYVILLAESQHTASDQATVARIRALYESADNSLKI